MGSPVVSLLLEIQKVRDLMSVIEKKITSNGVLPTFLLFLLTSLVFL